MSQKKSSCTEKTKTNKQKITSCIYKRISDLDRSVTMYKYNKNNGYNVELLLKHSQMSVSTHFFYSYSNVWQR